MLNQNLHFVLGIGGAKLLGSPAIPVASTDKIGPLISKEVLRLVEDWGCKDQVVGMVFDTTASNTGTLQYCG